MAEFIPAVPGAPGPVNWTNADSFDAPATVTIAAGSYRYARNLGSIFSRGTGTLTVQGTIYSDGTDPMALRLSPDGQIGTINNSGLIVFRGLGQSVSIEVSRDAVVLNNSGRIFAVTQDGYAQVFSSFKNDAQVNNSGLIAAQASGYTALGIVLPNGGTVRNTATGEILAQGKTAAGVRIDIRGLGNGPELDNAGRIEAHGTEGTAGIGVIASGAARIANSGSILGEIGMAGSAAIITNAGTIGGTVAALSFSDNVRLDNRAGGLIAGRIEGGNRDDRIDNAGTIDGGVRLYDGDDALVMSDSGRVTGVIDLGLGNDVFVGGDGDDRVAPDNGNDRLEGRGGNDLLLGGNDNDTLIGGSGNDGLYGENGNDLIVTEGQDAVFGGKGDDRVELGDWAVARADGGAGTDTLVLPGAAAGARVLDLSSAIAGGRVTGFEVIEMRGGQELVVRAEDVAALAGGTLRLDATASDKVDLVGGWTQVGTVTVGSASYARYEAGGQAVLVRTGASVAVMAAAPANATGLDAVTGTPAPTPGGTSGVALTPDELFVQYLEIYQPTIIPDTDLWFTTGKAPALWAERDSAALTVQGLLIAENTGQATAIATDFRGSTRIVVEGGIVARSTGAIEQPVPSYFPINREGAYAIRAGLSVANSGSITAESARGMAVALGQMYIAPAGAVPASYQITGSVALVSNNGLIGAWSDESWAVGTAGSINLVNNADILASGKLGAIGVAAGGLIENNGVIEVAIAAGGTGYGVLLMPTSSTPPIVTNTGRITAPIAIGIPDGAGANTTVNNSGTIEGEIRLGSLVDRVTNTGTIAGITRLGAGDDLFDGTTGRQGAVYGNEGNDTLIGGGGDDLLVGGVGADRMTGGAGADVFRGTRAELSGDTITDFRPGDRLHVSDAGPGFGATLSGQTLTFSTGETLTLTGGNRLTVKVQPAAEGGFELVATAFLNAVDNDWNGDGRSDVMWRNAGGYVTTWFAAGSGFNSATGFGITVGGDWKIAGNGDFTGDGRSDMLWRNDNGRVTTWASTGSGFNGATGVDYYVGTDWKVGSVGDFNGDGRADILWRNDNGRITTWASTGTGFNGATGVDYYVGSDWKVAGSGDINGDGRDDIVWRNDNGRVTVWLGTATGFNGASGIDYQLTSDWKVAGVADFNGDGRDDILWRNDNGRLTEWFATPNGGFAQGSFNSVVATAWAVADTGDYNGDGRADILWRNADGTLAEWLSNGTGFEANPNVNVPVPTDWTVFG